MLKYLGSMVAIAKAVRYLGQKMWGVGNDETLHYESDLPVRGSISLYT